MPYAHHGMCRLFGGGLAGSQLARQLLGTTVYAVVFIVFFRAFSYRWQHALCLTTAALSLSWILKFTAILFATIGMLDLRSALPTLLPVGRECSL